MSRILGRNAPKLLKIVNGKPHASSDDHEESVQQPKKDSGLKVPKALEPLSQIVDIHKPESIPIASLPQKPARTSPRKRKDSDPEVLDLTNSSSPKKQRLNVAPRGGESRIAAEKSLPSPESIDSGKRRNAKMQTETDFEADPLSSSEAEQPSTVAGAKRATSTRASSVDSTNDPKSKGNRASSNVTGTKRTRTIAAESKKPGNDSAAGFRKVDPPNLLSSRDNDTLPGRQFKKFGGLPKTVSDEDLLDSDDELLTNIFADVKRQKTARKVSGYGKEANMRRKIQAPKNSFQKAASKPQSPAPIEAKFKRRELGHEFSSQSTNAVTSSAPAPDFQAEDNDSPLSDLEPEEPEVVIGGCSMITCGICSMIVKKMLKEEYEDTELDGRKMTYKWQDRFCRWHKKQTAKEDRKKRGYPDIQWDQLKQRMRKHDKLISDVLNDRVSSYHRNKLQDNNKQGRKRQKDIVAEGNSKFTMGYYGPKGERRVHEYIMNRFADDLRKRSTKDKLILASGIQGGVNGFVQLVLAPHLAEVLVKEDMSLPEDDWEARARGVLAESTEIGELLWPEEQDKVGEDAYQNHIIEEESDEELLHIEESDDDNDTVEVVELD